MPDRDDSFIYQDLRPSFSLRYLCRSAGSSSELSLQKTPLRLVLGSRQAFGPGDTKGDTLSFSVCVALGSGLVVSHDFVADLASTTWLTTTATRERSAQFCPKASRPRWP